MGLPALLSLINRSPSSPTTTVTGSRSGSTHTSNGSFLQLLTSLDAVASHEIDASLSSLSQLNEPRVARQLSRLLPPGHGLFLGNSMPIRDMDMYGAPSTLPVSGGAEGSSRGGGAGLGVPVAANRGASGIDGVLSTAAGEGEGGEGVQPVR